MQLEVIIMIKLFIAVVSLLLCFLVSFCDSKSYENEQNLDIQLIQSTLSTKNIRIDLDKTKIYNLFLLYNRLRFFILKNVLPKIELDENLFIKITNKDNERYLFQLTVLDKNQLYHITYI